MVTRLHVAVGETICACRGTLCSEAQRIKFLAGGYPHSNFSVARCEKPSRLWNRVLPTEVGSSRQHPWVPNRAGARLQSLHGRLTSFPRQPSQLKQQRNEATACARITPQPLCPHPLSLWGDKEHWEPLALEAKVSTGITEYMIGEERSLTGLGTGLRLPVLRLLEKSRLTPPAPQVSVIKGTGRWGRYGFPLLKS